MQSLQGPTYHERQRLHQCLRHSLNNLFQGSQFSSAELDGIADVLAPGRLPLPFLHPHRTLLMGNYDVNVLEVALRRHAKELRWYDLRDAAFEQLDLQAAWALILNVQSHSTVGRWMGGRHWLALRRFAGRWWNLDSNLPAPRLVADCCRHDPKGESSSSAAAASAAEQAVTAVADSSRTPCSPAAGTAADGNGVDRVPQPLAALAAEAGPSAATAIDDGAARQEAEQAARIAAAATDDAALRRFLGQQVQQNDAKVFVVVDSPLESHPLQDSPQDATAADA